MYNLPALMGNSERVDSSVRPAIQGIPDGSSTGLVSGAVEMGLMGEQWNLTLKATLLRWNGR